MAAGRMSGAVVAMLAVMVGAMIWDAEALHAGRPSVRAVRGQPPPLAAGALNALMAQRPGEEMRLPRAAASSRLRLKGGDDNDENAEEAGSKVEASGAPQGEVTEDNVTASRTPRVIPPEVVQKMNEKMWEAAIEGNEPLFVKAVESGANVNAFCRLRDKWKNITVGEIAGFDESQTGLNVHWMELNNYTAMHLAAACGNAAIIDKLIEYGADINVECLQRVHPFPTAFGMKIPFLSVSQPLIYKCTPLRIARAANCGRCFFTSYQRCVDKLEAAKAVDNDFHYPAVTELQMIMGSALLLGYLGLKGWPFEWFEEWPYNWADYPDLAKYLPR